MISDLYHLIEHYPLEKLLQVVPAGIFVVTPDRKIVYWDEEAERITGFRATEVIGRSCLELHADACCYSCALFDETVSKPLIGETCLLTNKNGRRLTISKNADLLRAADGTVIGGIEAFVDRTNLKEVEQERDSLRSVLNGMTDPIYICNRHYQLLFFNRAMESLIGKMTDRPCYEVLYGLEDVCFNCPMDEVFSGELCRQETHLTGTGRTYEVLHSACHFHQHPQCKLGVCRDITERLMIRQRLLQANRELDGFVAMVSHDLRSPLTPLIGYAELLQERYSHVLDDLGRESVGEIYATAERMRDLLEDLLCLARVGQVPVPIAPVDTSRVVAEVVNELSDLFERHQAQIHIGNLPDVIIAESLLADIYRNLITNALKYGIGEKDPRIEVFGHVVGGRIELLVRDHGAGVADIERERIFEPFARGDAIHRCSGTGIGLATVAKIARVCHGRVWVEETSGGGATFVVELPNPQWEF